jgi:hypothetical protein
VDQGSSARSGSLRLVGYGEVRKKEDGRTNEQDIQDILVALLTEDSVQLGERGAEAEPTFEAVSTSRKQGWSQTRRGW